MMPSVSVQIDSIAAGGDGVGRTNGLVVFVPRTAPGDVVTAQISGRGHFARGALRSVVTPSPVRVDPPCAHYTRDRCGGCQIQHMSYDAQLAAKQLIVRDSLQRIGKRAIDPPDISRSPNEWRYRTKLTLAMRRRGGRWIAGLHQYDEPMRIFALADCPITDRGAVATWREIMAAEAYFPEAAELRGSVRITSGGPTLVMMGGRSWGAREQFSAAIPSLAALWWLPDGSESRQLFFDRRRDHAPSASFAQINAEVAADLRAEVIGRVKAHPVKSVIDAYSGAGHTAALLSETGLSVTAIELDREASAWSAAHLASGSQAICGRVEDVLPSLPPADLVILNPPRAGVDAKVTEYLEATAAVTRRVIYVSCNPATLARDIARLPSFDIASLRAFDMFPQTAHVETLCELAARGRN